MGIPLVANQNLTPMLGILRAAEPRKEEGG